MDLYYRLFKRRGNTLSFIIFLIGSYLLYWKLGAVVAIGVALEILSVYIGIPAKNGTSVSESNDENNGENDK